MDYDKEWIKESVRGKLRRYHGRGLEEATPEQIYDVIAMTVRDQVMELWLPSRKKFRMENPRRLYYLSIEFLVGRSLHSNMLNLVKTEEYETAIRELGLSFDLIEEEEPEPGLGNGGLGRLAACFIDSLATLAIPATGCSIRYEYGLFRQKIVDGYQVELPDTWLEEGNVWEVMVREDTQEVHFGGHVEEDWTTGEKRLKLVDYSTVQAVPYDVPVLGYGGRLVDRLRLWSAHSPKSYDLASFSRGDYSRAGEERELAEVISKVLYPDDSHYEGRELRLKQHYFFSSATVKYVLASFKEQNRDLSKLPDFCVMHVNDTHPGVAIPELMRLLMDEEGIDFETAEDITRRTFAYTNHTVMAEALERWPQAMLRSILPRIEQVLCQMNESWCARLWQSFSGQWDRVGNMAIVAYDQIHMAHLCIAYSFSVNGVSQLHADILKAQTFKDFYYVEPKKFIGITNGITHRRWLMQANPCLTQLIRETIGDEWITQPQKLIALDKYREDPAFIEKFAAIKRRNKEEFIKWLSAHQEAGGMVDPDAIFDVQAKRLHEYKRQLLNALHILSLYLRIIDDPSFTMAPRVFFFAAKAAPGYKRAKLIIRFIHSIRDAVRAHPRASQMINIIFVENYGVSTAEKLIPATDVSEQLSTAGKEASGTGNMKFMMNGAVTIGTLDGANVEMCDAVGLENIYIFGLKSSEVDQLYHSGRYRPTELYETRPLIRKLMEALIDNTLPMERPRLFSELYQALLFGDNGGMADPYLVLKDFDSYAEAHRQIDADYRDRKAWTSMTITNTAASGYFSTDRTIEEYNKLIWKVPKMALDPVK